MSGVITEYPLPNFGDSYSIVTGSDGNLWFLDAQSNKIGKITTSGVITEYDLPDGIGPEYLVAGPDGNLWFVDGPTNDIGSVSTDLAVISIHWQMQLHRHHLVLVLTVICGLPTLRI